MVTSANGQKSLSSGRVIIIKNTQLSTRYGMILSQKSLFSARDSRQAKKSYTVLLPCDQNEGILNEEIMLNMEDDIIVEPYSDSMEVYCPKRPCAHTIVDVREEDIVVITDRLVKENLNYEAMINDFNKRRQPRFRCVHS